MFGRKSNKTETVFTADELCIAMMLVAVSDQGSVNPQAAAVIAKAKAHVVFSEGRAYCPKFSVVN